ncbi:SH3 domain-containing protein [Bacillus sp. FJAT-42376]|uniref:SH3 domain-containing protein n=1 Tax=Bacillus sp. FJAT-42376 TaxID=2014076 RepID=UPI000F4DAB84|nr:SH3 domain-containing protein [Bacillus sp. FJAT-42376]AZB44132.1 SH3 domain-containing protein [Bacillus sp. FJAT-42376]
MNRWFKTAGTTVLAIGILSSPLSTNLPFAETHSAKASAAYTYEVTASQLNIRAAASTKAKIVGTLPKGAAVEIKRITSGWISFQYKGKTAYASSKYVLPIAGTGIAKANVNLRSSSSTKAKSLTVIPKGAKVKVHEWGSEWSRIDYRGKKGWASSKYLLGFD